MKEEKVIPGDFVMYPPHLALSSRLVAAGEILAGFGNGFNNYSHGAIVSDVPGRQYEAVFPKCVHSLIDKSRPYDVYRFGDPTDEQRALILKWCREHVGCWYDIIGVLTAGTIHIPGTYYCTRFGGEANRFAGIGVGDSIYSPDSIPLSYKGRLIKRWIPQK